MLEVTVLNKKIIFLILILVSSCFVFAAYETPFYSQNATETYVRTSSSSTSGVKEVLYYINITDNSFLSSMEVVKRTAGSGPIYFNLYKINDSGTTLILNDTDSTIDDQRIIFDFEFSNYTNYFEPGDVILINTSGAGALDLQKPASYVIYNGDLFNFTTQYFSYLADIEFTQLIYQQGNITAYDSHKNTSITNFNATINSTTYSTTNGTIITGLTGVYNITICSQFYECSEIEDWNISLGLKAFIDPINSIQFTFYNGTTGNVINGIELTVELLSDDIDSFSYDNMTTTSTLYMHPLSPGNYTTSVMANESFANTVFKTELNDVTTQYKNVFLFLSTETTEITYSVYSRQGAKLNGATVKAQRYLNNAWTVVAECTTNEAGQCIMNLPENQWYHYQVYYEDDITPKYVTPTPELASLYDNDARTPFLIDTIVPETEFFAQYDDITVISFEAITNNETERNYSMRLQATWDNENIDNVCMRWYRFNPYPQTEICDSCLNTSGNIIYCDAILGDYTYYAELYSVYDNVESPVIDRITFKFQDDVIKNVGIFLTFLMVFFGITIGLAVGDPLTATVGGIGAFVFAKLLNLHTTDWGYILLIATVAIILVQGKKDGGK